MSAQAGSAPRVAQLVARFEEIGRTVMRELPVYNPALEVEAVDFAPFAEGWLGVLITPWFMNVILLPAEPRPVDWGRVGRTVARDLPAGARTMMVGADEVVGEYLMLSLHSPMDAFKHQAQARSDAARQLLALRTPPEPPATQTAVTASRRGFLRGAERA